MSFTGSSWLRRGEGEIIKLPGCLDFHVQTANCSRQETDHGGAAVMLPNIKPSACGRHNRGSYI